MTDIAEIDSDDDPAAPAATTSVCDQSGPVARPSWVAMAWTAVGLLVLSVLLVGTYVADQPQLTLFDESVFLDSVEQATQLGVVRRGELLSGEALEAMSCRGVQAYGTMGSPCGGPYDPTVYPQGGMTTADVHPPSYFVLTAAAAATIRGVGLSDDLLTSARMAGALWLFLGLISIVFLALEVGARLPAAVGAAAVVASLPLTRYTNSYLTPDNFNLAAGALVMLAAVRFTKGVWPWWAVAVAAGVAASFKAQNGLAVGVAVILVLWSAVTARSGWHPSRRRHLLAAAGALVAFVAVQLIWQVGRALLAVGDAPDQGVLGPITRKLVVQETTAFIFDLGLRVTGDADPALSYLSAALLVAGCVGALLYRRVDHTAWGLAAATTCLLVIGSPMLVITWHLVMGEVIPSPTRYGGSLLPGMAAVTAAAFGSRIRSVALASFGVVAVGVMVVDNLLR